MFDLSAVQIGFIAGGAIALWAIAVTVIVLFFMGMSRNRTVDRETQRRWISELNEERSEAAEELAA